MIEQRYLSVSQAAVYLGVSQSAIRKWIRLTTIPVSRFNGSIRFDKQILDNWGRK
jgi:excisionase family DNA binding protein